VFPFFLIKDCFQVYQMKSYQTKYRNTNDTTLAIDQNKIWAANGVFAMAYHIDLPEKYSLGEDDLESINDFWHKAFKYLPTNTLICKQDIYAQNNLSTHTWSDTNFLQRSTKSYFNNRPYLEHSCNLFFRSEERRVGKECRSQWSE